MKSFTTRRSDAPGRSARCPGDARPQAARFLCALGQRFAPPVRCAAGVLCCWLAVAAGAAAAHGQLHATDVALKIENGRIVTGRIDPNSGAPVFPHQVYASVLGAYGIPAATFDPGFDSEVGAFPASTPVGITVRRALRVWDGQGFSTIPPERLEIIKNQTITTPASDPPTPTSCGGGENLELGLTTATGRLHQHPAYLLIGPPPPAPPGTPPLPGVYLLELHAWYANPGQGTSDPLFVLFAHEQPQAVLNAAVVWAEANLARPCYANCDRSTTPPILNVEDFTCFINAFASGDCYANCDGSTTEPVLNVEDFTCFINRFAHGCP
jgi:hypothetical protein